MDDSSGDVKAKGIKKFLLNQILNLETTKNAY